jgi:regulator of protease activity HflC (stomatin/prohibitin superfamily)
MGSLALIGLGLVALLALIAAVSGVRVIQEYERGIIFRLGRLLARPRGPGLFLIIPYGVDRMVKVNLQTVAMNVPPQDVITRDNVSVRVDAVIYFRVMDPKLAVIEVQNYLFATSQMAQTTLRATLGKVDLDGLLSQRDEINDELTRVIDDLTEPWGVKVSQVEIKNVDLPETMQRAMARQAEAERDRRARVISADGEFQASRKLAQAAEVMSTHPQALQLRFLQTVGEVATERNSTLVMPVPVELLNFFSRAAGGPSMLGPEPAAEDEDEHEGEGEEQRTGSPELSPPEQPATAVVPPTEQPVTTQDGVTERLDR